MRSERDQKGIRHPHKYRAELNINMFLRTPVACMLSALHYDTKKVLEKKSTINNHMGKMVLI